MGQLKIIKIGNKQYFFDKRLLELRNVKDPQDCIKLSESEAYFIEGIT